MSKSGFWYHHGEGYCESVPLAKIATEVGTPTYVYSKAQLSGNCRRIKAAFSTYPTLASYALKANGNTSLLKEIIAAGFGAEGVSIGEIELAVRAGANPKQIVFSGVGKQDFEISRALEIGILSFNVESAFELESIRRIATEQNVTASVMLRINPNIPAKTNPHIATGLYETKFGIAEEEAMRLAADLIDDSSVVLIGLSCHIGSQITEVGPFAQTAARMAAMAGEVIAMGHKLQFANLGGGWGIAYQGQTLPPIEEYAQALIAPVRKLGLKLMIEPGRSLTGDTGILLTKVIGLKATPVKRFVVVDGAMNDLIRPCLYEAFHRIETVKAANGEADTVDIVGPICETADFLGLGRTLTKVSAGDLLMVRDAGAYGYSMSSNYNARPRAAEVLVDGGSYQVVRRRESLADLLDRV